MIVEKPVIICLTPVRNEAWILDTFLKCTSLWADHIIIADQHSTDGSREIAQNYPKVILIDNNSLTYDEQSRQQLLLSEARKISGKRLLITLDADEFFTANFQETKDWQLMINSSPGDFFGFRWANIRPGFKKYWLSVHFPWAMMDDNSSHSGNLIHSPRLPFAPGKVITNLEQIMVLHYQYTNWSRMKSKHRYYQCIERINFPLKSSIHIYRMYHHMYTIKNQELFLIPEEWFEQYEARGIKMRGIEFDKKYWFDEAVLIMFNLHGTNIFRKEAIWDIDWNETAKYLGMTSEKKIKDPRNVLMRILHFWLKISQYNYKSSFVGIVDSIINRTMLKLNI